MDLNYRLIAPQRRFMSQVRDLKILNSVEQRLQNRRNDTSNLKFDSKLDTYVSTSSNELNKTAFEDELKDLINQ